MGNENESKKYGGIKVHTLAGGKLNHLHIM